MQSVTRDRESTIDELDKDTYQHRKKGQEKQLRVQEVWAKLVTSIS